MAKQTPIDYLIKPMGRFMNNSTTSGIVLFIAALAALIMANSPLSDFYKGLWEYKFTIGFENYNISKTVSHWINDGLMAMFFFVIGLELKREVIGGELSNPKDAILPIFAGIGGMVVPAVIYLFFNFGSETEGGWGIPMATDIAFALGIIYLLGDRVPLSLKIFLTALAIADDLGAVLVIAFFYTSQISYTSLAIGAAFLVVLYTANRIGVRRPAFYGIIGVGGVWLAFLLSGVHATIAGVLAALTIPANVKVDDILFSRKLRQLAVSFENAEKNENSLITKEQLEVIEDVRNCSKAAITPLQQIEHSLHPIVAFIILPLFAFANTGVEFSGNFAEGLTSNITLGIIFGLLFGKFIGIVGVTKLIVFFKLAALPQGANWKQLYGVALLASVGFTMSLFITELAFTNPEHIVQAKFGIIIASVIGGISGYLLLRKGN
ncbi:MAG TPA: Na+/H+ antiporter NhaA [Prolixibacteraceae bacterium]|nr:MAG: Na+/H+ antiporter NhaA [Bacteroidetes bacterium GWB2_41_8]HCY41371.1 Na+/H+ antiporter NhaA [Prolixibacteraceae bacterium]